MEAKEREVCRDVVRRGEKRCRGLKNERKEGIGRRNAAKDLETRRKQEMEGGMGGKDREMLQDVVRLGGKRCKGEKREVNRSRC